MNNIFSRWSRKPTETDGAAAGTHPVAAAAVRPRASPNSQGRLPNPEPEARRPRPTKPLEDDVAEGFGVTAPPHPPAPVSRNFTSRPPETPRPVESEPSRRRPAVLPNKEDSRSPLIPAPQVARDLILAPQAAVPTSARPEVGFDGATVRRRASAPMVATEDQIAEILNFAGEVSTAPSGSLSITPKQRTLVAYLSNGVLVVHKDSRVAPDVMEVKNAIRLQGRMVVSEYLVELDVIRKIYEAEERRSTGGRGNRSRGGETLQQMQHEVLNLITEAASRRASDVHVTVERYEAQIRIRSDGVMMMVRQVPSAWAAELCAAAFNMADSSDPSYRLHDYQGARISEIRTPLPQGVQSVRLQFNPLPNSGRYLVMRLLYAATAADTGGDVDTLGYAKIHVQQIQALRRKPYGINIISGPTGSGKSTTLQRSLSALMREKRNQINVITIEDPPEYVIPGAAQFPVTNAATDEERNEKFRAAISASLRSDPDIIMIGEIRDAASASLAFQAAMTGHQVWASLHANNAVKILARMRDLGVEPYKLGDPDLVTGLIGQRLIRRLCSKCCLSFEEGLRRDLIPSYLVDATKRVARARLHCVKVANPEPPYDCGCRGGFMGREVLAEVITPDLGFMKCVRNGDEEGAVAYWLDNLAGMTMLEHAAQKMVNGLCDPRDVSDKAGNLSDITEERLDKVFGALFTKIND